MDWALALAAPPPDGVICDAGCGPGGDIASLLTHVPEGRVEAVDLHDGFLAQAAEPFADEPRVSMRQGNMGALTGPCDLIWSAGALYVFGVTEGLTRWRTALAPGGAVAFSEACWFTDTPSARARAYWAAECARMTDAEGNAAQVKAAGFDLLGRRRVSDTGWEAYVTPMEQRIAPLRPDADAALAAVLDEAEEEIATWRACRSEYGHLLSVARPA